MNFGRYDQEVVYKILGLTPESGVFPCPTPGNQVGHLTIFLEEICVLGTKVDADSDIASTLKH